MQEIFISLSHILFITTHQISSLGESLSEVLHDIITQKKLPTAESRPARAFLALGYH
jgi:hypothetical protein